jgi:hypothetical protein
VHPPPPPAAPWRSRPTRTGRPLPVPPGRLPLAELRIKQILARWSLDLAQLARHHASDFTG